MYQRDMDEHLKKCALTLIDCTCSQQIQRSNMETHLKNDCPKADIECKFCGHQIRREFMKCHYGIETDVDLEQTFSEQFHGKCPASAPEDTFHGKCPASAPEDTFHGKCPEYEIDCPYKRYGCTDKIKRKDRNTHLISKAVDHMKLRIRPEQTIELKLVVGGTQHITILETPYLVSSNLEYSSTSIHLTNLSSKSTLLNFAIKINNETKQVTSLFNSSNKVTIYSSFHYCNKIGDPITSYLTNIEQWID
jgi:hypothetical protein